MLKTIEAGPLGANCYIYWDEAGKDAFIIDPGGDAERILKAVKKEGLKVKYIINTHGHFDHVGANGELKVALGAAVAMHGQDLATLEEAHEHGLFFGFETSKQSAPDMFLEDGQTLAAGSIALTVMHTPGHSKGGICLYARGEGMVFTGDTLFAGSVGRTDFPGGSYEELMDSIRSKLLVLDDSTRVYPGHGPQTTIGAERRTNPFLEGLLG